MKLAHLDRFGVPITLKVNAGSHLYKTNLGATTTMFIYLLSLAYAMHVFYLWYDNQISPKMSSSSYNSDFSRLVIDYHAIHVYAWIYEENQIDPFQQQNNILMPLIQYIYPNGSIQYISILNETDIDYYNISETYNVIVADQAINKFLNVSLGIIKTLLLVRCETQFLQGNQTCADDNLVDEYFKQSQNCIGVDITSKLLNSNFQPEQSIYTSCFLVEPSLSFLDTIALKTTTYNMRENLFVNTQNTVEYLSGQMIFGQTNTIALGMQQYNGYKAYACLYIQLQSIQELVTIEYPHIGELLAQIGSITNLLFLIQYLILAINQTRLWDDVINQVICFYYPKFSQVKITKNRFGKIIQVRYQDKNINLAQFNAFYQNTVNVVNNKLTFTNIIYEMSRIYFILRSMQSQNQLKKAHMVGIDFNIAEVFRTESIESPPLSNRHHDLLNDYDLDLLSLSQKEANMYKIPDELSRYNEFYESNRIT